MGYTGVRVGQALSSAFAGIGDALYNAAYNAQQMRLEKNQAAEEQRRYDDAIRAQEKDRALQEQRYSQTMEL